MKTSQGPFREGNMAIFKARGVTRICLKMAVEAGVLDAIIPEPYAAALANGILNEFVQAQQITLNMIERWVQEFVAAARARQEEEKALTAAREIVVASVQAAAQAGQLQSIALYRQGYVAQLILGHEHLAMYMAKRLITPGLVLQWLNEAIANVAAHAHEERGERA